MNESIETINDHMVGVRGDGMVTVLVPPFAPMEPDEALRLAAWLALVADPSGERFEQIRSAIANT